MSNYRNLTEEQAKDIIAALKTLGYEEVDYNGYEDHIDNADTIYLFNPTTKKGMYIAISDPTDQQCFDEHFVQDVDEQFDENLMEKGKEAFVTETRNRLVGMTVEEAAKDTHRSKSMMTELLEHLKLKVDNNKIVKID